MAKKIKWDETGKRLYETGVEQGVLYVQDETGNYPKGVPWNGFCNRKPIRCRSNTFICKR